MLKGIIDYNNGVIIVYIMQSNFFTRNCRYLGLFPLSLELFIILLSLDNSELTTFNCTMIYSVQQVNTPIVCIPTHATLCWLHAYWNGSCYYCSSILYKSFDIIINIKIIKCNNVDVLSKTDFQNTIPLLFFIIDIIDYL